jgi:hypothetical protein
MGQVDHTGKRLGGSRVRRDQLGTVKDPHTVILHDDLDMVAHQSMGHAVTNRIDVHEGVERDATAQALRPLREGVARQRPEGRPLVSLETHDRRFTGRSVAALIGDRDPLGQVLLERAERVEGLIRQCIALDVFDTRFRLAFGPGAIRGARAGCTSQSRQKAR